MFISVVSRESYASFFRFFVSFHLKMAIFAFIEYGYPVEELFYSFN